MEMHTLVLSIGSNLGDRLDNLYSATLRIQQILGEVVRRSSVYESKAWGFSSEHSFYNQCLLVNTGIEPLKCLEKILEIERDMGRIRENTSYADRIIDVDILLYDELILNIFELRIPHDKMLERRFVLLPLAEIHPELIHPVALKSIRNLLLNCRDTVEVHRLL